ISQRRLGRLDDELELTAGAAAVVSVAPAVRAKLMAAEMQRKSYLLHFDAAKLDATGRLPFTGARPAIADPHGASPGARLEQMPDERLAGARIDALDGQPEAPAPTRHRPIWADRCQCADDRLDDLLGAVVCT